jgi:hypothetical protein
MAKLKFIGEISITEILNDYQLEIYDSMLNAIKECYRNHSELSVHIIDISINDFNHSIQLSRPKFVKALTKAIKCFEKIEAYEKCQECVNIINYLKSNTDEL